MCARTCVCVCVCVSFTTVCVSCLAALLLAVVCCGSLCECVCLSECVFFFRKAPSAMFDDVFVLTLHLTRIEHSAFSQSACLPFLSCVSVCVCGGGGGGAEVCLLGGGLKCVCGGGG